jgi:hypothetical protein
VAKTTRKKISNSQPPTLTTEQALEQWLRHFDTLSADQRAIVEQQTLAAREASGSRLAVAKHLSSVRSVVCANLTNPKQKRMWTLFLRAKLPGLAFSRSQVFKDMQGWEAAQKMFPAAFLDSFLKTGYALAVRPSVDAPLGKYTEPCQHVLSQLGTEDLSESQMEQVLAEVVQMLKDDAKKSRVPQAKKTAEEKRVKALSDVHEYIIAQLLNLAEAVEPNEKYTTMHLRDDLELIMGRVMTATNMEVLDAEPKSLPKGFSKLAVPEPESKDVRSAMPEHLEAVAGVAG